MGFYIGMDIGGTKCSVTLAEGENASIIGKTAFATLPERGHEAIISQLVSSAQNLIEQSGIDRSSLISCGVSCGGPLDPVKGVILGPPNLPGWSCVPLADILSEKLGIPCLVRNDADACALAEWKFGAGKGCENMIFLTFGTGMGAGLILGGRLYSGSSGTAGEVGHVRLEGNGPVGYGKAGSFEGFCSGGGIEKLAEMMLSGYEGETALKSSALTAKDVAEAARKGDALALRIYRVCGDRLGKGLAVLIDILNPEKIIIGSVYARACDLLCDSMRASLEREALGINLSACEILPAGLGESIGDYAALGVAALFERKES